MAKKKKVPIQPLDVFANEPVTVTIEGFEPPLWWAEEYGLDFEVFECLNYNYFKTKESLYRNCEYGIIQKNKCKLIE